MRETAIKLFDKWSHASIVLFSIFPPNGCEHHDIKSIGWFHISPPTEHTQHNILLTCSFAPIQQAVANDVDIFLADAIQ